MAGCSAPTSYAGHRHHRTPAGAPPAIAETGVDVISVGAVTQRAPAVDIGLDIGLDVRLDVAST